MEKLIMWLGMFAVICTVNYPESCDIVKTEFTNEKNQYRVMVECEQNDPQWVTYWAQTDREKKQERAERVDYFDSELLVDSIELNCEDQVD